MGIKSISNEKINSAKPSMRNKIFKNILNSIKQHDNDTLKIYLYSHMEEMNRNTLRKRLIQTGWRL
jgi:hypothetical protein